jgi:hypothetical protein
MTSWPCYADAKTILNREVFVRSFVCLFVCLFVFEPSLGFTSRHASALATPTLHFVRGVHAQNTRVTMTTPDQTKENLYLQIA